MQNNIIPVETSKEGLQLLHQLLSIAKQAHGPNASPVDIKLRLAELNEELVYTTHQQTIDVMINHGIPCINKQI